MQLFLTKFLYVFGILLIRYCSVFGASVPVLQCPDGNLRPQGAAHAEIFRNSSMFSGLFAKGENKFRFYNFGTCHRRERLSPAARNPFAVLRHQRVYARRDALRYVRVNNSARKIISGRTCENRIPGARSALSGKDKRHDKINTPDEDEDDELVSLKKNVEAGNYFASIFHAQLSPYSCRCSDRSASSRHFSYSAYRYIVLRVIRV